MMQSDVDRIENEKFLTEQRKKFEAANKAASTPEPEPEENLHSEEETVAEVAHVKETEVVDPAETTSTPEPEVAAQ